MHPRRLRPVLIALAAALLAVPAHARAHRPVTAYHGAHYAAGYPHLARTIHHLLQDPAVSRAHWGISISTLSGRQIYSFNSHQYFHPASNAKLFTTAATLALFQPDARWRTTVTTTAAISPTGTLHGNIVIHGSGDPTLSSRVYPYDGHTVRQPDTIAAFEDMANQLVKDGIHRINGNVIGDDSWFTYQPYPAGWALDDTVWDYGAPISALTINDNVVYLNVVPAGATTLPNASGAPPQRFITPTGTEQVEWNPPTPYYHLDNETTLLHSGLGRVGLDRAPGSRKVRLFGTIDQNGFHAGLAIIDPAKYAAATFAMLLRQRGIQVTGVAQAHHLLSTDTGRFREQVNQPIALHPIPDTILGPPTDGEHVLATYTSQATLAQDLKVTLKVSQNLHAELYLRDLGRYEAGDGSIAQGARVVHQFAIEAGVNPTGFIFFDGSGMSHDDVVTPHAITTLLAYASHQSWGRIYRNALPAGGIDGTLSDRFTSPAMRGRVHAKTGTLDEVNSLSGYVKAHSGRTYVFSILCNNRNPDNEADIPVMDSIVRAIATE
jgi:D-alanyl-D-alanine carboxypeptidase/D-alanyl-D-alanine-endopeptidase (penicillin-binding protein 4)